MNHEDDKKPDSHVAYAAFMDGVAAVGSSISVVGRYWWNLQMRLLVKIGVMPIFRAHWWIFLIVGFILLAFVFPFGVAFAVSAFCAAQMEPKAINDFVVPLRRENLEKEFVAKSKTPQVVPSQLDRSDLEDDDRWREDIYVAAGLYHATFLRTTERVLDNAEFSAAALGAFDGTVQASRIKLTHLEMMAMGSAFLLRQLQELGRVNEIDSEKIGELTVEAMTSDALEEIRRLAGRMAYSMHTAQRH